MERIDLIRELTEAEGPSGFEGPVREIVRRHLDPLADRVEMDGLGSLIGIKQGTSPGPRVMLAGHMDEIGFLVTRITDDGFIKFQDLGGWFSQVMLAQRVTILTRKGPVMGVIGSKPPHILTPKQRSRPYSRKEMFIDIGAPSEEVARAAGVRPGDPIVPICPFTRLADPKYMMGKAWDDRYGVVTALEVLRSLQGTAHPNVVQAAFTVQEEVGLRGARTSAQLLKPDVAISLDVGLTGDIPGVKRDDAFGRLGEGPTLLLYDRSLIPSRGLRDLVFDVAEAEKIRLQFEVISGGGTDGGAIHLVEDGIPTVVIGVPTRYIHSHAAVFHEDDVDGAIRLVTEVVRRLDQKTVDGLRG